MLRSRTIRPWLWVALAKPTVPDNNNACMSAVGQWLIMNHDANRTGAVGPLTRWLIHLVIGHQLIADHSRRAGAPIWVIRCRQQL